VLGNLKVLDSYELSAVPNEIIAAQLYTESRFNPYLVSTAHAYGRGQLTEIAFLDTMYSLLEVPGGFDEEGRTKVGSLVDWKIEREANFKGYEKAFAQLPQEIFNEVDAIIEGFSTKKYKAKTKERIIEYSSLEREFQNLLDNENSPWYTHRERIKEIKERKSELLLEQEDANKDLRLVLKDTWDDLTNLELTPKKNSQGKILWYEIDPTLVNQGWLRSVDLFTQLNLRKEYSIADVDTALFNYNHDDSYVSQILADADELRLCFKENN